MRCVLLAGHYFLAAFEQVFAAFAKLARLFLGVFLAFVGSRGKIFARLFARFWRKKNSDKRSDAHAHEEKTYLRAGVIRHVAPPTWTLA